MKHADYEKPSLFATGIGGLDSQAPTCRLVGIALAVGIGHRGVRTPKSLLGSLFTFFFVLLFSLIFAGICRAEFPMLLTSYADSAGAVTTENVCDKIGAMLVGNTLVGIVVEYKDEDNTIDFTVTATGVWHRTIGTTCDTLWFALVNDTLYFQLCPDSSSMWSTNELSIGQKGTFRVDSLAADSVYTAHMVATTQLKIPVSATPAVAAEGEIAWDSDDDKIVGFDGANTVAIASKTKSRSFVIENVVATHDFPFWRTPRAIVLTYVSAQCKDGTNVVGQLQEYDGDGLNPVNTMTTDLTITTTQTESATFSNAAIAAGNSLGWLTTSVSGTVTILSVTVEYYEQ